MCIFGVSSPSDVCVIEIFQCLASLLIFFRLSFHELPFVILANSSFTISVSVPYETFAYLSITEPLSHASRRFMVHIFTSRFMICVKFAFVYGVRSESRFIFASRVIQFQNHLFNSFFYTLNLLDTEKY